MGIVMVLVEKNEIPVPLALITLCREFLITGMRMVAASKGIVVAADSGGKSKTMTQLIALGFFLGVPMLAYDFSRFFDADLSYLTRIVETTGLWVFVAGTVLSVWSGYRYISNNARLVFADE
jgi:CDP-diacylglycerol--glycerol-3-phosphate 3-phosphatidyltransferase